MSSNVLNVRSAQGPEAGETLPARVFFERAEVRVVERQLLIDGRVVPIGSRAFDVLIELLLRRGRLVTKGELLDSVWAGLVVEENNLPTQISTLRKWLGPHAISTIPGRGYRFSADLRPDGASATAAMAERRHGTVASPIPALRRAPPSSPPAKLPALIGRSADLDALRASVSQHRVVTVVGAGGVGKTRLVEALAFESGLAGRFRHGICWLSLASISPADSLPASITDAIGVSLGSGDDMQRLRKAAAPLSLLLVLDSAEHLLDATRAAVEEIERAAADVHIVLTSQAPLQHRSEHIYRLRGLDVPAADVPAGEARRSGSVSLFVERATAADARFVLSDAEVATVVDTCRALDGLALAIELAAARVSTLGVEGLLRSLDKRLRFLAFPTRHEGPARQRTLQAAIEWSHGLLGSEEQVVFRRLGVLPSSASLDTIQALVTVADLDRWQVLDALSALVDRSLVDVIDGDDSESLPRYQMLESPRLYAADQLEKSGETAMLQARHALVVADAFDEAYAARWDGFGRVDHWRAALRPDVDSARAGFAWALANNDGVTVLRIGATLNQALSWSLHSERAAIGAALQSRIDEELLPADLRLRAAFEVCTIALGSRADDMRSVALQAVALAGRLQDGRQLYSTLSHLACALARLDDSTAAEAALIEMRALEDPTWAPQRLALGADAEYLAARTDPLRAIALSRRQMALTRQAGGSTWMALLNLVDAELVAGNAKAAAEYGDELLEQLRDSRDERGMAYARLNLTSVRLAMQDTLRARALAELGWPLGPRFDLQAYWADVLALLAAREGRVRQAARLAGYSDARYRLHQDARAGNEEKAYAEAVNVARNALGKPLFERLRTDGETLADADVAAQAFSTVDR